MRSLLISVSLTMTSLHDFIVRRGDRCIPINLRGIISKIKFPFLTIIRLTAERRVEDSGTRRKVGVKRLGLEPRVKRSSPQIE